MLVGVLEVMSGLISHRIVQVLGKEFELAGARSDIPHGGWTMFLVLSPACNIM
jgi:hypothetical protein